MEQSAEERKPLGEAGCPWECLMHYLEDRLGHAACHTQLHILAPCAFTLFKGVNCSDVRIREP